MKKIFQGELELEGVEDSGQARICLLNQYEPPNPDGQMFVRVQSWDEAGSHPEIKEFEGKLVRITIETL